jgi:hypothetical protein
LIIEEDDAEGGRANEPLSLAGGRKAADPRNELKTNWLDLTIC